jgi:Uma2 family endonuclease
MACADIRVEDDHEDTLLNPVVLIEVLSPSTEAYDRGEKFAHYRRLDSLREYVLVAQDQVRVERYVRQGDQWILSELSAQDDVLQIDAIGCSVRLSDVYRKVKLPNDGTAAVSDGPGSTPGSATEV